MAEPRGVYDLWTIHLGLADHSNEATWLEKQTGIRKGMPWDRTGWWWSTILIGLACGFCVEWNFSFIFSLGHFPLSLSSSRWSSSFKNAIFQVFNYTEPPPRPPSPWPSPSPRSRHANKPRHCQGPGNELYCQASNLSEEIETFQWLEGGKPGKQAQPETSKILIFHSSEHIIFSLSSCPNQTNEERKQQEEEEKTDIFIFSSLASTSSSSWWLPYFDRCFVFAFALSWSQERTGKKY